MEQIELPMKQVDLMGLVALFPSLRRVLLNMA